MTLNMRQKFHAVYEHGILRPLIPLNPPESAKVTGFIRQMNETTVNLKDLLMGFMFDEPELIDAIVEEAMVAREAH